MVAKPVFYVLVELFGLLVVGHHLLRQRVHQLGGQLLPGEAGVLPFSGLDGDRSKPVRPQDVSVSKPRLQPLGTDPADGRRRLIAGQQGERAGVGEVEGPFQCGEDAGELGSQAVDGAGAVGNQVHATAGEEFEVGDGFVAGA
ncbi:hypothetical protein GCM10010388_72580 [Streptomyces mauvecolor]